MTNQKILPVGAAVHTRGCRRGEDYGWYVKIGCLNLFSIVEELYRVGLREIEGQLPIIVLYRNGGVGFLIAHVKTEREDFESRLINDALYLEFSGEERDTVFKMVAMLLTCSSERYEQYRYYFGKYAEELYRLSQNFFQQSLPLSLIGIKLLLNEKGSVAHIDARLDGNLTELYGQYQTFLQTTTVPIMERSPDVSDTIEWDKFHAFIYGKDMCQKCASYLFGFTYAESLCFISTGLGMTLKKFQQLKLTEIVDKYIVLTESSKLIEEIEENKSIKQIVIDRFAKIKRIFK